MQRFFGIKYMNFIEGILDGMQDWVRVIDLESNIIYANKAMRKAFGCEMIGKKCFEAVGKLVPCENCISKRAADLDKLVHKEEEIRGDIYSVMSSPLKNNDGIIVAVIEVFRNITKAKIMEKQITLQNKKFTQDLQIARTMQYSLLPKEVDNRNIRFDYIYMPCETIGGDFFDIYEINGDNIGVYMADVSGHGVPASMLTMFLRQTIKKDCLSPAMVLKDLYKKFNEAGFNQDFYITMFYAVINIRENEIRYANAGHNASPLLFNGCDKLMHLNAVGIPISDWIDTVQYEEHTAPLKAGDKILFCTDGVTEMSDLSGEMYGESRLEEFILKNREKHIQELRQLLLENIKDFKYPVKRQISELSDDLTLLFVEMC